MHICNEMSAGILREEQLINISTASGIMMNQFKLPPGGTNILSVNQANYAKGVYFIQVKITSADRVRRLVLL